MEVQEQFGSDVRIIGVPGLSDLESMERFVAQNGTDNITHIPDLTGDIWEQFGVRQHRAYVIVDDDGTSQTIGYGSLPSDVEALIAS